MDGDFIVRGDVAVAYGVIDSVIDCRELGVAAIGAAA